MPHYVHEFELQKITVGQRFRKEMGNIDELVRSIKEKGLIQPVTIDESGNLLAGGRRVLAAKMAQFDTIPVVVRRVSDEVDAREIELYENIHRKDMSWQEQCKLEKEIHDLGIMKNGVATTHGAGHSFSDTAEQTGVSPTRSRQRVELAEYMEIIPELAECKNEDEARRLVKRMTEEHAVAQMREEVDGNKYTKWANNHYKIGDAITAMSALRANLFDFQEVDPPYAIDLPTKKSGTASVNYNEVDAKDYGDFLKAAAKQVYRTLSMDRYCVWWFGPSHFDLVKTVLMETGFALDELPAIWYKDKTGTASNNPTVLLGRAYEMFFVCRKGSPTLAKRGRSNVFAFQSVSHQLKKHPTERPIELVREILQTFCLPGASVCSPFLGSGTTILAAYESHMTCVGWDLSPDYKKSFMLRVFKAYGEAPS